MLVLELVLVMAPVCLLVKVLVLVLVSALEGGKLLQEIILVPVLAFVLILALVSTNVGAGSSVCIVYNV